MCIKSIEKGGISHELMKAMVSGFNISEFKK